MRTPQLPAVDWTDAPADLNGLVRFAERRNLVSARVPSRFKHSLPHFSFTNSSVKWNDYHFHNGFEYHRVETVPETFRPPVQLVREELQPELCGQSMRITTHQPLGVRLRTSTAICLMLLNSVCEINTVLPCFLADGHSELWVYAVVCNVLFCQIICTCAVMLFVNKETNQEVCVFIPLVLPKM